MSVPGSRRLLTLRSGGWVLAVACGLTLAGTLWNLAPLFDPRRPRPRGDGRTVDSYQFNLETVLVPKSAIVSSGMVTDALPPLIDPKAVTLSELSGLERVGRGAYLVPS